LLEFDDTANDQRKVIYEQRNELLDSDDISQNIIGIRYDVFSGLCQRFVPPDSVDEQWDIAGLERALQGEFGFNFDLPRWVEQQHDLSADGVREHVIGEVDRFFREKEAMYGSEILRAAEKFFLLQVLDQYWKEHLAAMDYLRQGIYLRGYAQVQPKQEFKRESFLLFQRMLDDVKSEVVQRLARIRIQSQAEVEAMEERQRQEAARRALEFQHAESAGVATAALPQAAAVAEAMPQVHSPVHRDQPKVGRNDPCPCGSGKKYKQCHGKLA
ncbi:MAG: SEC-C domain-containing protein, partial [Proteobacteria bacterium]|nr:SEC-C domain-containing protein [Pseudomonadota bacterium]